MKFRLANPRGFCAGVDRAIEIVNRAIEHFGAPVYVRHEVVHNKYVVDTLRRRGAIFVDELTEIPDDAVVVYSAHGVSRNVRTEGESRPLKIFDATCPLVTKVHIEVQKFAQMGVECILIGHAGHPEVEGTMGQYSGGAGHIHLVQNLADVDTLQVVDVKKLGYVTQTTLSIDDTAAIVAKLKKRFPEIRGPRRDDICYATQNRQDAVKQLALECTLVLVVGSPNSSNSNRLMELARRCGTNAFLIDGAQDIQAAWLRDDAVIGITAGASAPEKLVAEVVNYLVEHGAKPGDELPGAAENIQFSLPPELRSQP